MDLPDQVTRLIDSNVHAFIERIVNVYPDLDRNKLNELWSLRGYRTKCPHIFRNGPRAGDVCNRPAKHGKFCGFHSTTKITQKFIGKCLKNMTRPDLVEGDVEEQHERECERGEDERPNAPTRERGVSGVEEP